MSATDNILHSFETVGIQAFEVLAIYFHKPVMVYCGKSCIALPPVIMGKLTFSAKNPHGYSRI